MKTANIKFSRGIYTYSSINKDETVRDYKLLKTDLEQNKIFTEIIRIEKDNGFHDRSRKFEHYLYLRNCTNWKRCSKTGLAFTQINNVFEGNISRVVELQNKNKKGKDFETPQHFTIVQFLENKNIIVLDIFENFYPHPKELLNKFIAEHKLYR